MEHAEYKKIDSRSMPHTDNKKRDEQDHGDDRFVPDGVGTA